MRKYILFALMCCTQALSAQKTLVFDENAEARPVPSSFNAIKVSGGISVYLSQSDKQAVAVGGADSRILSNLKTVVEGNTLRVFYEGKGSWNKMKNIKVYIAVTEIIEFDASGACDIAVSGTLRSENLTLRLSGASNFKGQFAVGKMEMLLSGASDMKVSGTVSDLNIESSGASDVDGFKLVADRVSAKASGASDINITVNRELSASASGASNISYKGPGVVKDVRSSGSSSVARKA